MIYPINISSRIIAFCFDYYWRNEEIHDVLARRRHWKSTGRIDHREKKEIKEERKRTCLPYRYYVNVRHREQSYGHQWEGERGKG